MWRKLSLLEASDKLWIRGRRLQSFLTYFTSQKLTPELRTCISSNTTTSQSLGDLRYSNTKDTVHTLRPAHSWTLGKSENVWWNNICIITNLTVVVTVWLSKEDAGNTCYKQENTENSEKYFHVELLKKLTTMNWTHYFKYGCVFSSHIVIYC